MLIAPNYFAIGSSINASHKAVVYFARIPALRVSRKPAPVGKLLSDRLPLSVKEPVAVPCAFIVSSTPLLQHIYSHILGSLIALYPAGILCCWYNPKGLPNDQGVRIDCEIRDLREVPRLQGYGS